MVFALPSAFVLTTIMVQAAFGAPGFMDGQSWLMNIASYILFFVWLFVLIGLLFFRIYWRSSSRAMTILKWSSMLLPSAVLIPAIWLGTIVLKDEVGQIFYSQAVFFALLFLSLPVLVFGLVHLDARILRSFRPEKQMWAYNVMLVIWVATPAVLISQALWKRSTLDRQFMR